MVLQEKTLPERIKSWWKDVEKFGFSSFATNDAAASNHVDDEQQQLQNIDDFRFGDPFARIEGRSLKRNHKPFFLKFYMF